MAQRWTALSRAQVIIPYLTPAEVTELAGAAVTLRGPRRICAVSLDGLATPDLKEEVGDHERLRIIEVGLHCRQEVVHFPLAEQSPRDEPVPDILDKLEEDWALRMAGRVDVDHEVDLSLALAIL